MTRTDRKPWLTATMTASVPYKDLGATIDKIVSHFPSAPCMPVLTRSIKHMLEGIPCLVFDREKKMIFMDISSEREDELLRFYDRCEAEDFDWFATTEKTAPGLYALIERLKDDPPSELKWMAFQNAGPLLLSDAIKQPDGTAAFHNETMRDVLIKGINMKARWLEDKIKSELPGVEVIAGLSEANLVTFTSAGGTGSREEILDAIDRGVDGLECVRWIHCCANIDWTLLTNADIDVINFDGYRYTDKILLYHRELQKFLEKGGMLGWGIVPVNNELVVEESVDTLAKKLEEGIDLLVDKGVDRELLISSSWILPCCETVMMTPELSDAALSMTRQISDRLREKYGVGL